MLTTMVTSSSLLCNPKESATSRVHPNNKETRMGQSHSVFEQKQFDLYTQCTYFNEKDILRLYKRFYKLDPVRINPRIADVSTRLTFAQIQCLPELRENPFKERICQVFSTDGYGIHFEDFLDIFSVLSSHSPWELKAAYAFRIFDYNGDAAICKGDIKQIVHNLTGDSVNDDELYEIVSGVMKESDIAKSRKLTYTEFEHVISRAPDFADLFHVTI